MVGVNEVMRVPCDLASRAGTLPLSIFSAELSACVAFTGRACLWTTVSGILPTEFEVEAGSTLLGRASGTES